MSQVTTFIALIALVYSVASKLTDYEYAELTDEITTLIKEKNCAPILVRLAWHDAGTYDKESKTGGPRAAQRFDSGESTHAANNGLEIARNLYQPLVEKYCDSNIISIADLWALGGNIAISVAGGPDIPFRFGRKDIEAPCECVEDGRLPDAKQGVPHVRSVLGRIGFMTDAEVVALSGAHTLGSCHDDRSGFDGPWTVDPFKFDNSYFKDLVEKEWFVDVSPAGNTQFVNDDEEAGKRTIMLPSDWDLVNRKETKAFVEQYAKDEEL
eukprot:412866_1